MSVLVSASGARKLCSRAAANCNKRSRVAAAALTSDARRLDGVADALFLTPRNDDVLDLSLTKSSRELKLSYDDASDERRSLRALIA